MPARAHLIKTLDETSSTATFWCERTATITSDPSTNSSTPAPASRCPDCTAAYAFATGTEHPRTATYVDAGPQLSPQPMPRRQPKQLGTGILDHAHTRRRAGRR